jgi:hypothetical protein
MHDGTEHIMQGSSVVTRWHSIRRSFFTTDAARSITLSSACRSAFADCTMRLWSRDYFVFPDHNRADRHFILGKCKFGLGKKRLQAPFVKWVLRA